MENIQEKKTHYPRIYTIHSQKGGVGKTSIAIAIAGFANIFHNKNVLIIDADLTGASLFDMRGWAGDEKPVYFNDVILAKPAEFAKYTLIKSLKSRDESLCERREFYQRVRNYDGICYVPASPCFDDVLKIVPLISQEDLLHFFRHRLEDIVAASVRDQFDVIIIDHPPGLFGISTASLRMVLDQEFSIGGREGNDIAAQAIFITTPDSTDYRALLPSFSRILEREGKILEAGGLGGKISMILNKVISSRKRFDPPFEYEKILNDVKELPDRKVSPQLIDILRERAKKIGALACGYVANFDVAEILTTIQSLKYQRGREYRGMKGWCIQLARSVDLWKKDEDMKLIGDVKQNAKKNSG